MEGNPEASALSNHVLESMSLHAQELDLYELHKLDSLKALGPGTPNPYVSATNPADPGASVDIDDVFPSESFSTQPSPEGSLADNCFPPKPQISIFQRAPTNPSPMTPSQDTAVDLLKHPKSPASVPHNRARDDTPTRFSDVETSPLCAGSVGSDIPQEDPLDSDGDGEWWPTQPHIELPTEFGLSQTSNTVDSDGQSLGGMGERKKKKRKKRSKAVKGPKTLELEKKKFAEHITGFEEFYADPPLRPEEAEEEEAMYDTRFSVAAYDTPKEVSNYSRAEKVVQRYRAARRFNSDRERIFTAYLRFGGIRTGPKQFQSLDPKMEGTAEDFVAASSKDAVEESVLNNKEVDFVWVIRGFLSYYFPTFYGWKGEQDIILACDILTNFLNYVEIHDVFPEYAENIKAAKDLIVKAMPELIMNRKCCGLLPGKFNKACSTYFGGYYNGLYLGSSDEELPDRFTNSKAITFLRRARGQIFLAEKKAGEWSFPCEVIGIQDQHMILKQWIPEGIEEDYVEPEFNDVELRIFLEPEILEFVYVGMHIEATWHRLTNGIWYMDQGVHPTFALEVPEEEYPYEDPEIV